MSNKKIFPVPPLFEPVLAHLDNNFTLPSAGLSVLGGVKTYTAPVTGFDPIVPLVYDGSITTNTEQVNNAGRVQARGMVDTRGLVFSTNITQIAATEGSILVDATGKSLTLKSKDITINSDTGSLTVSSSGDTNITAGVAGASGPYFNSNVNVWASGTGTTGTTEGSINLYSGLKDESSYYRQNNTVTTIKNDTINLYSGPEDGSSYYRQNNTVTTIKNDTVNLNGVVKVNNTDIFKPAYGYSSGNFLKDKLIGQNFKLKTSWQVSSDFSTGVSSQSEPNGVDYGYFDPNQGDSLFIDPHGLSSPIIYSFVTGISGLTDRVTNIYKVYDIGAGLYPKSAGYDNFYTERYVHTETIRALPINIPSALVGGINFKKLKCFYSYSMDHKINYSVNQVTIPFKPIIPFNSELTIREFITSDTDLTVDSIYFENPGVYQLKMCGVLKIGSSNYANYSGIPIKDDAYFTITGVPYKLHFKTLNSASEETVSLRAQIGTFNDILSPVTNTTNSGIFPFYKESQADLGPPAASNVSITLKFVPANKITRTSSNNIDYINIEDLTDYRYTLYNSDVSQTWGANVDISSSFVAIMGDNTLFSTKSNQDYFYFMPSLFDYSPVASSNTLKILHLPKQPLGIDVPINIDYVFTVTQPGYVILQPDAYDTFGNKVDSFSLTGNSDLVDSYTISVNRIG